MALSWMRGSQQVADLGDGIELIWTPAVDGSDILGIPALEAAPQAPHIWVYPPTKAADSIIVNPVYPPEYKDFILVFPADSGIKPVYVVVSVADHNYHPAPKGLIAFPDATIAKRKTPLKGGGGLRKRWKTSKGTIFEWARSTELWRCTTNAAAISENLIRLPASKPNLQTALGVWSHDLCNRSLSQT